MYLKVSLLVLLSIHCILSAKLQFEPLNKPELPGEVFSQEKDPICCIPAQLETSFVQVGTMAWHPEREHKDAADANEAKINDKGSEGLESLKVMVALLSYDYTSGLVAVTELSHDTPVKMIFDFNQGKGFFIYGDKCSIKTLKKGFNQMCVPGDSKLEGSFNFGYAPNIVNLDSYLYQIPSCSEKNPEKCQGLYASLDVTPDECMISSVTIAGKHYFRDTLTVTSMVNTTAGIADPAIFNVPSVCTQTNEEYTFDWFKFMMPKL